MIQISREEAKLIRNKYPKFTIMTTGKLKQNHHRKKYYIQPYILFSECNDVMHELEKYIDVYGMISRNDDAERCYMNFKNEYSNRLRRMKQTKKQGV